MADHEDINPLSIARSIGANLSTLPDPIQTGFWKAAGRLVGGALSTPAAWLRRPAQAFEDKTDAQSLVTRRIAEAVAERAVSDPAIIERAMGSFVREEFRKQSNKERVAEEAAAFLRLDTPNDSDTFVDIDDDWMNVFVRYAEDASSERMQKLWGRVLSGEIRKPGDFSLSTIRFLSELDSEVAKKFEDISPYILNDFIFKQDRENIKYSDLIELESFGLINLGSGMLSRTFTLDDDGSTHILGQQRCLKITGKPGSKVAVPAIILTRLGREVLKLISPHDETDQLTQISEVLKSKENVDKIHICLLVKRQNNILSTEISCLFDRNRVCASSG